MLKPIKIKIEDSEKQVLIIVEVDNGDGISTISTVTTKSNIKGSIIKNILEEIDFMLQHELETGDLLK